MPVVGVTPDYNNPNDPYLKSTPDWEWKTKEDYVWRETGEGGYWAYDTVGSGWEKKSGSPNIRLTIGADSISNVKPIFTSQGNINIGTQMSYNGVPVVYVPQEFANQGLFKNGTQYYSTAYLNKDLWQFAKPVILDQPVIDNNTNLKSALGDYQYKNYGYIIDQSKFNEYKANTVNLTKEWGMNAYGDWKRSVPIQGITDRNGQLMYYGMRGSASAGEITTFDSKGSGALNAWKSGSSGFIPRLGGYIGDFISDIRPIAQVASIFSPPVATFLAAYDATTAATQGKWGQAMMAALPMFVPSASGQPPIIDIPAVAEATKSLSSALNISTQAAGNMVRGAVELAANGGDLKQLLTKEVATYLGQQAGGFVEKLFTDNKLDKLGEVAKSVSAAGTRALLLNQNVGDATKSAFIKTAVPMAMETVPGWADFAKSNPNAANDLKSAAVTAAQTGDFKAVVQDYSGRVITRAATDAAERELNAEGKSLTDSQKRLISSTVTSAIQGKPIDAALQRYAIDEAKRTVNDGIAVSQGWESDAQRVSAQKMYGNTIKPQEYIAKQQGWEDLAEKNAALKAYGNTITPVGFKEREQVKSIDPTFDAAAYSKLNEVAGDPYQHFLTQGKQANLPTNYEKGAEEALKSIGYKADQNEIKQVADLFKNSANPDVALNQFYDQRWVTPEEAAATAKSAGFELTPQQLAKFTGQARVGQDAVLEDVAAAAKIGKASQDTRNAFIDKQLDPIVQAYKKEGYSDAEIQAAVPKLREQLDAAIGNKVTGLSDYASQVKAVYGEKSPEYAAAQRKLLDAQAQAGGYGLVQEGTQYKSVTGESRSADLPTQIASWTKTAADKVLSAVIPSAQAAESPQKQWYDQYGKPIKEWPSDDIVYDEKGQEWISGPTSRMAIGTGYTSPHFRSGVFDQTGREYSVAEYVKLPAGATVYDADKKPIKIGDGMSIDVSGTQKPSTATEQIKKDYALIGVPGEKPQVYSPDGAQKITAIGEQPSGSGDIKVPTLFGMPLSAGIIRSAGESWLRADDNTWVTPDNTYSLFALPGKNGQVIDNKTKQIVVEIPRPQLEQVLPKTPMVQPPPQPAKPITPRPPIPEEPKQTQVEELIQKATEQAQQQRVSAEEVQDLLKKAGYQATPEEIAQFTGVKPMEQAATDIQKYVDPRMVTSEEVLQMYRDLGLQSPTEADIARFVGQREQTGMPDIIRPYLPTASANVITQQAEKDKLNVQQQQQQFGDINNRINQLQQQGLSQTEATNQALRELASGQSQLGQQIGQQQQQTQQQFGDVNTRIAQLQQQGLSLSEATNRALQELTAGQSGLGQRIGELATGQTGLQNQLGGLTSGLTQALTGLGTQIGKTNQGLQQQIGQVQQQANFANLLTLLGVAKQQEKEPPPIPLTGKITPYEFSTDLLAGIYQPPKTGLFGTNQQLLNLSKE